jgi:hypothetical protein
MIAPKTLDDFASGTYGVTLTAKEVVPPDVNFQTGTMVGNIRATTFSVYDSKLDHPLHQTGSLTVANSAGLVVSSGVHCVSGLELGYGFDKTAPSGFHSLHLDLSPYERLTMTLGFLDGPLNTSVVVRGGSGESASKPLAINAGAASFSFSLRELIGNANIHDVDTLRVTLAPSGAQGAVDYLITALTLQ